jgi:peptide/nickel transport system substrate-binding protein
MTFGVLGENVFKDERVRQAFSMAFDRDLDVEVRFNVQEFEDNGIPVRTRWNSHLSNYDAWVKAGWWLDPKAIENEGLGENAKYFQYNPTEAKALIAAAGYPDGFDIKFNYPNAQQFDRGNIVEPYFFYLQEIGLNVIDGGQTDYTQDYIPNNRDAQGQFEGLAYHSVTGSIPVVVSPTSALVAQHLPSSGVTFHGYSLDGGTGKTGDPTLVEILQKAKVERDTDARIALVHEAQRHLAKAQWSLTEPGGATSFFLAWPAVQNYRVWQSTDQTWEKYKVWLDTTKAPFA